MQFGDSPEGVERELQQARAALKAFEEGVDNKRIMARMRKHAPLHPVLLGKGFFSLLMVICLIAAAVVIVIPFIDPRSWAALWVSNLDAATGLPGGLPGVLLVLSLCWFVGWLMAGQAALAIAREAPMLPIEQKEHQRLVNEVTRLSSQKSVMERIRGTPMGARPRISTPVPVSMRQGGAQPIGTSRFAGGGGGGASSVPAYLRKEEPSYGGGVPESGESLLGRVKTHRSGGYTAPEGSVPSTSGGLIATPSISKPKKPVPTKTRAGTPLGAAPRPSKSAALGTGTPKPSGGGGGGIRLGAQKKNVEPTEDAEPQFDIPIIRSKPRAPKAAPPKDEAKATKDNLKGSLAKARSAAADEAAGSFGDMFGTPAPASRDQALKVEEQETLTYSAPPTSDLDLVDDSIPGEKLGNYMSYASTPPEGFDAAEWEEAETNTGVEFGLGGKAEPRGRTAGVQYDVPARQPTPTPAPSSEAWLQDALDKAEIMAAGFPVQAQLKYNVESYLPFTLEIARATPASAVRSMVQYVEFLASVATPHRGRIELISVPHLDRSFHRNVMAALEPYFPDSAEVERHEGHVEILFLEPDPRWKRHPELPTR